MQCPHCHHNSSRVVDSRPTDGGRAIRRRRECENCGFRFTTFERVEQTPLLVIKKNGTREEFNREKILKGLIRAAEKRPVTMEQMQGIVDSVENQLRAIGENEVSSQAIGEYVMSKLRMSMMSLIFALPVFTANLRICPSSCKSFRI
ncbi:transcriptional regulator NrdR [Lacticaseibacillus rhamnosus MTCC 5462]|nr:transcriptional regulator NrdR [Lacticaseibacillus rhamnosus MTCC 5462]